MLSATHFREPGLPSHHPECNRRAPTKLACLYDHRDWPGQVSDRPCGSTLHNVFGSDNIVMWSLSMETDKLGTQSHTILSSGVLAQTRDHLPVIRTSNMQNH